MATGGIPIGVIGLGLLGTAIAERLLATGFSVTGFDILEERGASLQQCGGTVVPRLQGVAECCEVVILSLPSSDVVSSVVEDIGTSWHRNAIVVDTTTGDPSQMVAIGKQLAAVEANYVESNVAGSSQQLRSGSATLFLGGDSQVVETVEAVLSALSPYRFHLGAVGSASKFKLVHNVILGLHRLVLAEGLCFAESLGFNPQETLEILLQTPAASTVMKTKGTKMATRSYEPQARLSQHLKDVRLILEQARHTGAAMPLSEVHRKLLEQAESLGFGDADNSAIIEAYRESNRQKH